jgi:hypothetical protein
VCVLILLTPTGFWFFNMTESENQRFWGVSFSIKNQNQRNHVLWSFEKPQRTRSFHERTNIEPVVCMGGYSIFQIPWNLWLYMSTSTGSLRFLVTTLMNPQNWFDDHWGVFSCSHKNLIVCYNNLIRMWICEHVSFLHSHNTKKESKAFPNQAGY